jgi:hypothetical protein
MNNYNIKKTAFVTSKKEVLEEVTRVNQLLINDILNNYRFSITLSGLTNRDYFSFEVSYNDSDDIEDSLQKLREIITPYNTFCSASKKWYSKEVKEREGFINMLEIDINHHI